jgi:hypothetical protein
MDRLHESPELEAGEPARNLTVLVAARAAVLATEVIFDLHNRWLSLRVDLHDRGIGWSPGPLDRIAQVQRVIGGSSTA